MLRWLVDKREPHIPVFDKSQHADGTFSRDDFANDPRQLLSIPDDLVHAARLDGCGELTILWRIVMPLMRPAATAFAIVSVVSHWNDLFWPLIVLRSPELSTPPLGLLAFHSSEAGDHYGELMTGSVVHHPTARPWLSRDATAVHLTASASAD